MNLFAMGSLQFLFSGQTTRIGMATELVGAMLDFDKTSEELIEMYTNATASGGDADPFFRRHTK